MVRRCERPGCGEPAELGYGIDAEHLTVWIEPLDPALPDRPGVLCRRHADSMVVPLRWTLDDRREAVPRLFRAPAGAEPAERARPARAVRAPRVGEQLALDAPDDEAAADGVAIDDRALDAVTGAAHEPADGDGVAVDVAADDVATGTLAELDDRPAPVVGEGATDDLTPAAPWRPVFDPDDDLDGLLDATGPLLSRAFNGRSRAPSDG